MTEPTTWLEHLQAAEAEGGADQREGAEAARKEIETDNWTRETARRYLDAVPFSGSPYAKGYDNAVRWFAEVSCGRSPSPGGPR